MSYRGRTGLGRDGDRAGELLDEVEQYRTDWATDQPGTISPTIRRKAIERGYAAEAFTEDDPVAWLSERIATLEDGARPLRRQAGPKEIGPDRNLEALAQIMAADAADDPAVRSFRRVVLRGRLLKPHRLAHWIEKRVETEGPPTRYVELPTSSKRIPQPLSEVRPGMTLRRRLLPYETGGPYVRYVPVADGGYLDALRNLSAKLSKRYGWHKAHATRFVLTGEPPPIVRARASATIKKPFQAAARITLELSPRMSPDEVRALYVEARTDLGDAPGRIRKLSDKHAELAVFAFKHRQGYRWADAMTEWNRRYPQWAYEAMERFNRDARLAYQRVTGDRLEWIGAT